MAGFGDTAIPKDSESVAFLQGITTANEVKPLLPHAFFAVQVILPATDPKLMTEEGVFCPIAMADPDGAVHRYCVAPDEMLAW
jgi:hypothetical protein